MSEKFQDRLRKIRQDRGLSQSDLAQRAGFQPSAISHFETGTRAPSFDNLRKLADAVEVSIDFLLGRQTENTSAGPVAEQLYRDFDKLSSSDQETVAGMAKMLAKKHAREQGEQERTWTMSHYKAGEKHAERVLEENDLSSLPVCPFELARKHDIAVETKQVSEPGVTGFLMRVGNSFGIYHASHIRNEGFVRFTVAHELGHYFIPGHPEAIFPNGDGTHTSRAGTPGDDRYEQEADGFASGLLMPRALFVSEMRKLDPGFKAIDALAKRCHTSILSTAIRYAQFAEDPVAVIVSTGATIDYCFMSDAVRNLEDITWIKKGTPLPPRCLTRTFNENRTNVSSGAKSGGYASLDDWFDGARQVEMKEDVVGLGGYGRTLTVLFTDGVLDEDDDD